MTDGGHDTIGEHDQRDVPVPAVPGTGFVVVEAEFVLGGLETFLDPPTRAFYADQCGDGCSSGAPSGEIGEFTIGEAAPDQQPTGPDARKLGVIFGGIKISQRAIGPIVEPLALCAMTCGQARPGRSGKRCGNILGLSRDEYLRMP